LLDKSDIKVSILPHNQFTSVIGSSQLSNVLYKAKFDNVSFLISSIFTTFEGSKSTSKLKLPVSKFIFDLTLSSTRFIVSLITLLIFLFIKFLPSSTITGQSNTSLNVLTLIHSSSHFR